MNSEIPTNFTRLLNEAAGNPKAAIAALQAAYKILRRGAQLEMQNERLGHSLGATGLIHEIYPRLFPPDFNWNDRAQFFRTAADVMRKVLIDHARARARIKRGGGRRRVDLETVSVADLADKADQDLILSIDNAICDLAKSNPEGARIVKLRFYGGLTSEEVAEAMGISRATVARKWAVARACLARSLQTLQQFD